MLTLKYILAGLEADIMTARFLPQNKVAEGGPGSGRHKGEGSGEKGHSGDNRDLKADDEIINTAVGYYCSYTGFTVNAALRAESPFTTGMERRTALALDGHMDKLPPDVTSLYRGVPKLPCEMKVGETFQDKAFSSTSIDRGVAIKFATSDGSRAGIIIHIVNPGSAKGVVVGSRGLHPEEKEVILERGCHFKVTGIRDNEVSVKIIK